MVKQTKLLANTHALIETMTHDFAKRRIGLKYLSLELDIFRLKKSPSVYPRQFANSGSGHEYDARFSSSSGALHQQKMLRKQIS